MTNQIQIVLPTELFPFQPFHDFTNFLSLSLKIALHFQRPVQHDQQLEQQEVIDEERPPSYPTSIESEVTVNITDRSDEEAEFANSLRDLRTDVGSVYEHVAL